MYFRNVKEGLEKFSVVICNVLGGGSNNKKDHAAGKNPRCPLSFLFFFVLFQNKFKIDVFVPNLVKNVSSKKNKKDHDFGLF